MKVSGSPSRRSPRLWERDRSHHFVMKDSETSSGRLSGLTSKDRNNDVKESRPHKISGKKEEEKSQNKMRNDGSSESARMTATTAACSQIKPPENFLKRSLTPDNAVDTGETKTTTSSTKGKEATSVHDGPPVPGTQFSRKDSGEYLKILKSSQGFHTTPWIGMSRGDCITPLQLPDQHDQDSFFSKCAREAVKLHNEDKEDEVDNSEDRILFQVVGIERNKVKLKGQCGKVEFKKLIKMNASRQGYLFITMECKDLDDKGKIKQYQSILDNVPQPGVFRLKMFRLQSPEGNTSSVTY